MTNYTHIFVKDLDNDCLVLETVVPTLMLEVWFHKADEVFAAKYGDKAASFYYVFGELK